MTPGAGFTGYDLWREILESGCELLIRVGGNVRLLDAAGFVRQRGELVLLWPDAACPKRQPPLVLRIVRLTTGRTPMLLVTSVLDRRLLSDREALAIYRRRWGVEVFLRTFKQTFERGELCSRAPANAEWELAWSLVALWGVQLLGASELIAAGFDPAGLSTAAALRALRAALAAVMPVPVGGLLTSLARPADDGYRRRSKASRDYPRKRRSRPPTVPRLHALKHHHITRLKAIPL
ncbi:MAG: transposase [Planctomycetaceae bacterium]|nr:transposase [Planctomycetaceae bacterium]